MAGEVLLGKVEAECHWGQEGTPGFSSPKASYSELRARLASFRDVFMTCGVKGFERDLAPKFSHVGLSPPMGQACIASLALLLVI